MGVHGSDRRPKYPCWEGVSSLTSFPRSPCQSNACTENAKDYMLDYMSHPDLGCSNYTGTSCVTKFLLVESSQPRSSVVRASARKAEGLGFDSQAGYDCSLHQE